MLLIVRHVFCKFPLVCFFMTDSIFSLAISEKQAKVEYNWGKLTFVKISINTFSFNFPWQALNKALASFLHVSISYPLLSFRFPDANE